MVSVAAGSWWPGRRWGVTASGRFSTPAGEDGAEKSCRYAADRVAAAT